MPILFAFAVNGALISGLVYFTDIDIFTEFPDNINLISLILGFSYLIASGFLGGIVRATSGVSLVLMSTIDFGLPEPANTAVQAVVAVVGALTPF